MRADEVLEARFTPTQFGQGYDEGEVDTLLDAVVEALRHHEGGGAPGGAPLRSEAVAQARFTPTRLRRGYEQEQVDDVLDRVRETLESFETGTRAAPAPRSPAPVPPRAPSRDEGSSSAVRPVGEGPRRGVGARILGWMRGDPR